MPLVIDALERRNVSLCELHLYGAEGTHLDRSAQARETSELRQIAALASRTAATARRNRQIQRAFVAVGVTPPSLTAEELESGGRGEASPTAVHRSQVNKRDAALRDAAASALPLASTAI